MQEELLLSGHGRVTAAPPVLAADDAHRFTDHSARAAEEPRSADGGLSRDLYAREALAYLPRTLCLLDRHPFHATYGCFDRNFWHYRTADFPSAMYQEAVLPLALVY